MNAASKPRAADLARGKWPGILKAMGVADEFLRDKQGPCPVCGGKTRYRFDDKDGNGTFYCQGCEPNAGDGFDLLRKITGKTFADLAKEVERLCGSVQATERKDEQSSEEKRAWGAKVWRECEPADLQNAVGRYLFNRLRLTAYPSGLVWHHGLWHKGAQQRYPGMVARIINADGAVVGLHRTYLTESGQKAPVEDGKKTITWLPQEGAAVRLCASAEVMGIAEGIETALAASGRFHVPCWAAICEGGLSRWIPPASVKRVVVFGDNDANYVGQAAAYALAKRLALAGIAVQVCIPETTGKDWADGL